MSDHAQNVARLKAGGFSQEEIDDYTAQEVTKLQAGGFSEDEIADYLGMWNKEDDDLLTPIREYWEGVAKETKRRFTALEETVSSDIQGMGEAIGEAAEATKQWAVGNDAEFADYFERGLGKSTVNLALQYHTNGEYGVDALEAMTPEPEDTGHLERAFESIATIGADLPIYLGVGAGGTSVTGGNVFAGAASAGFVNGSLKTTYMSALEQGKVDNAGDWWKIFIQEGFKAGAKEGIILGTTAIAPSVLGVQSTLGNYATQFVAFEGMNALVNQKLPTKDELINSALVGGVLMGVDAGFKFRSMATDRAKTTNKNPAQIVDEAIKNPRMLEDVASTNMTEFRDKPKPHEVLPERFDQNLPIKPEAEPVPAPKPETPVQEQTRMERNFQNLEASDAVNDITANVRLQTPREGVLKDFRNKFVTQFLDKLHPIHVAVERARKAGVDVGLLNPYQRSRIQAGMENRANSFLTNGTLDFNTMKVNGKSLFEIVEPIKNDKDYKNAIAYLIAKRAVEKASQGVESGFPIESAKKVIAELEPQFGNMQKDIVDYQNRIVDYTVDAGLISKADADAMKEANQDYVPFFRVLDDALSEKNASFGKAVVNPYKKMRGGEQPIFNPLESIVNNTMHHVTIAERNVAFVDFIKMVEQAPELFPEVSRVKAQAKPTKIDVDELQQAFDSPIRPEFADGLTIFRREHGIVSDTQIAIFRNGKKEIWEVGKDLRDALKDTNRYQANMLIKFASVPSRLLRAGSTLAPDFMLRNFNRDTVNSAIVSDRNFIPFIHSGQGFWHILKQDKMYQEWATSGAMQSSIVSLDRNYFQRDVKKFLTAGKVRNQISNPLETLRLMAEAVENTTRVGNFERSMTSLKRQRQREGKEWTDKEIMERAGFESRDLMDFARIGTKVQAINMMTAFFNARLQGYAKIYDAFKRNPKMTATKIGAYITAPSLLLWYLNHDDERYKQLPQWEKDMFWIIITPELGAGDKLYKDDNDYTIYRVPKPFELGLLFGTLPERAMDWAYSTLQKKKDGSAEQFMDNMKEFATSNLTGLAPIPDIAKPAVEAWSNKSLFTNMPIIPYGTENMLPRYQYNEYTSETAKVLGKTLDQIGLTPVSSPAQIDAIIQNWTGTLGRYAIQASDAGLRASGYVKGEKPEPRFEDLPVIKAFLTRNPKGSSVYISRYYEKLKKLDGMMATKNKLTKEGNAAELAEFMAEANFNLLAFEGTRETMSGLRTLIRNVNNNKDMSAEEKRQLIDQMYQAMIDIAKNTLETYYGLEDE